MKKYYQQALIVSTLISSGVLADEYQAPVRNNTTSMPSLITMEQLSQTSMQCRIDVAQLHQQRATVPREKMRDYSIALGIAADKCDAIIKVFLEVQKASQDYATYQNHLQKVQSLTSTAGTTSSDYNVGDTQPSHAPTSTVSQGPIVDTSSTNAGDPIYQPLGEN